MKTSDIKYCLPIIESASQKVLKQIRDHKSQFDFFEIWLDYLSKDSAKNLIEELNQDLTKNYIYLFRRQNLETPKLDRSSQQELMHLISSRNSFIDLDIGTQTLELESFRKLSIKTHLITSFHDYHATPETNELKKIHHKMLEHSPAIVKFSCFCNTSIDAVNLLHFGLWLKELNNKYIVLGMGEEGKVTRVFNTLWGNAFIFAPLELTQSSAPGQLTRFQLEKIFTELK